MQSKLDLDHISESTVARWIIFFISLGAIAKVDLDAGGMILDKDSIYPFLILTLVPLCSILKIRWQALSLVRRCCIPIGIIVCLMNGVVLLSDMSSVQSFFAAQKLFYAPLAFGIFLSFLLYLVEPKTTDELKLSSLGICSLGVLLIFAVLGAVFSITGDVSRTNLFIHVPALMILLVIGLICFVYPDFLGYTLIQKAYKASLASVMVFSCYGVVLHIYGFASGSQEVITSMTATSLLGIMYGSLIALFAISAGGQAFQTKEQGMFFDWRMIGFYVFFVLIFQPPPSLLDAAG